jgi:glucan 1,3-beta-glucosidase
MRGHYNSWYTEEIIANLSMRGIERVRLPIGDWTMNPYGPYIGCMEGAEERIEWLLDTCAKYNIGVLLDVHTAKNSQNGFDNSGIS